MVDLTWPKHSQPHRFFKDFQDLEGLLVVNHLDPNTEKIRQLFIKYGTLDLHEKIVRACSNDSVDGDRPGGAALPDLEFPIAPGFISRPPRLDPQVILHRCAKNLSWRCSRPGARERRLAEKIPVQFVL